jgi:hypothetical protein
VLLRGALLVGCYFVLDWALASFAYLRRRGFPRSLRHVVSLALAVGLVSGAPLWH